MTQVTEDQAPRHLVANSEFLSIVGQPTPPGACTWVTCFPGNPDLTDHRNWFGKPYSPARMAHQVDQWIAANTYFAVAAFRATADGEITRRKANFARLLALVVDDVLLEDVRGQVSYVLQTSPGKTQVGILLDGDDSDCADLPLVTELVTVMAKRGMMKADTGGNNAVRYVRLPVGQNQKPRAAGAFDHQLERWNPNVRLTLADAAAAFGIDLDGLRGAAAAVEAGGTANVSTTGQDLRLRELVSNVIRGEALHDGLNQIAASMVATGMPGGAVVNLLRGLMDSSQAPHDERWLARYQDIPRSVTTAQEKFARPLTTNLVDKAKGLPVLDLHRLHEAARAVRWAIKHVIPDDSVGVMFGASGTFKSFLALDMALHMAHGLPWLGKKTKKGPVVYLAAEGGAGLMRRVEAWHLARGLKWAGVPLYVVPVPVMLNRRAAELAEAVASAGVSPTAVVIDTMSQTYEGEENSAGEVAKYFNELGAHIRATWNCAVLVVHHSGHSATERPRGSSAITANVDFVFGVFRDEKEMMCTLECQKQKDGDLMSPATFQLTSMLLGKDEDGDELRSLAAKHLNQASQLLAAMQDQKLKGRAGGNLTDFLNVVQSGAGWIEVRNAFYKAQGTTKNDEAKKKAWNRAFAQAKEAGLVEYVDGVFIVHEGAKSAPA